MIPMHSTHIAGCKRVLHVMFCSDTLCCKKKPEGEKARVLSGTLIDHFAVIDRKADVYLRVHVCC